MWLTDDLAVAVIVGQGRPNWKIPEVQGEDLHSLAPKQKNRTRLWATECRIR